MAVPRGQCSSHRHAFQHRCREDTVDPVDYASTLAQTIYWTGAVMSESKIIVLALSAGLV